MGNNICESGQNQVSREQIQSSSSFSSHILSSKLSQPSFSSSKFFNSLRGIISQPNINQTQQNLNNLSVKNSQEQFLSQQRSDQVMPEQNNENTKIQGIMQKDKFGPELEFTQKPIIYYKFGFEQDFAYQEMMINLQSKDSLVELQQKILNQKSYSTKQQSKLTDIEIQRKSTSFKTQISSILKNPKNMKSSKSVECSRSSNQENSSKGNTSACTKKTVKFALAKSKTIRFLKQQNF